MSEIAEIWQEIKAESKAKRARNRQASAKILRDRGIPFTVHNYGHHLVVMGSVDFWPGTGLWHVRGTEQKGRGVMNLINLVSTKPRGGSPLTGWALSPNHNQKEM